MKLVSTIALLVALVHTNATAGPCARKDFKTALVQGACGRGGQDAAKDAMKAFAKEKGIKSCNQCHSKLAPTYDLKPDGLDQFIKLGGQVLAVTPAKPDPTRKPAPTPTPTPTTPATPTPTPTPATPAAAGDPKIAFEKYTLENGLEVILAPDKNVPIVAVNVWYHVGSGYETYGRSGFAHLFEHMMFQGSKNVGADRHFPILKKIGESGVNGTTNLDRTNYFEVIPAHQLETALWLESDRMGYLLDPVPGKDGKPVEFKESLANQIDVVRNERRQRYDNVPYNGTALFAQFAGLYPERHPYRYLTIGKHQDLVAANPDDVKSFFRTWYVPANATLAIVGDFDPAAAKQLVARWFGSFPKSTKPRPVVVPAPTIRASETVVSDEFAKLRQIRFSWHSPAVYADGDAELEILGDALTREGPGRLYKALVYDKPIAQSVTGGQDGNTFSGIFSITVTLRNEANLDDVKKIVAAEIARVTKEAIGDREVARVIARNEAFAVRAIETVMGRAERLQSYNHYLGDPDKLSWDLDRFRKTSPERIRAAAAKYLLPDRVVITITNPKATGGSK